MRDQLNNIFAPLIRAEGADSSRFSVTREIPQELLRRGGSRAARGKRAPAAAINNYSREGK
jgi:hypothetical protein